MNTTTAGRCNAYYRIVNGNVKLSVTFHSNHGISFLSETGSSTAAIFDAFRTTGLRNQKYYIPMGGRKMVVVSFYRNWRENETWKLKPKRTAAASRGFLLKCAGYVSLFLYMNQWTLTASVVQVSDDVLWSFRRSR